VRFSFIATRDHSLMRRVHQWPAPRWLQLWMIWATRGGDGWLWYGTVLAVLVFGGASRYAVAGSAGLAAGTSCILFQALKRATGRKRPCDIEPHCWANLLPPDQFSFPSGHTLSAFAVAISIGLFYPRMLPVLMFCAASIGASRILLGMHFLSDVILGALLGTALGYGSYLLFH